MQEHTIDAVILVDENDVVIGEENKYLAHTHPAKRHRAVSVWIIRDTNQGREVFFQKRSDQKIVGANQWGNGICGNVRPGESYTECAQRRLKEEIGIKDVALNELFKFEYKVYSNEKYGEHEIDQVFMCRYDGKFQLNPSEVAEYQWVSLDLLSRRLEGETYLTSEETLAFATDELKFLTPPLEILLNDIVCEVAPWTALMLFDEQLRSNLHDFS